MNQLARFKNIQALVFDIDGVLTDGSIYLLDNQQPARAMNTKDGYALHLAVEKGLLVAVISGAITDASVTRLNKLGITEVHTGIKHKGAVLEQICNKYQIAAEQVLFMGDDIPDLEAMAIAGLACCPADACTEVLNASHYVSPFNGGRGCVRDVIEKVLKLQGKWMHETQVVSS